MTHMPIPGTDDFYEVGVEAPPLPAPKKVHGDAPPPPVVRQKQPTDIPMAEEHATSVEEEQPTEQVLIPEEEQPVDTTDEPAQLADTMVQEDEEPIAPLLHAWSVPPILTGTNDLYIGTTLHHDESDAKDPLISLFIREVPTGDQTIVRTFRADELSDQTFLDNMQKAFAKIMQDYLLAWTQREQKQRDKVVADQKRKARQAAQPAVKPTTSTSVPTTTTATHEEKPKTSPAAPPPPVKKPEGKPPEFVTNSLF